MREHFFKLFPRHPERSHLTSHGIGGVAGNFSTYFSGNLRNYRMMTSFIIFTGFSRFISFTSYTDFNSLIHGTAFSNIIIFSSIVGALK